MEEVDGSEEKESKEEEGVSRMSNVRVNFT
jgi:hypothetical protein